MGAFHAYDIRGVYNVDFDKTLAYKVGYFLPELLSADKVLVGRDARVSSPEIHEYLLKGITDAGADVYDIGLSTTPMVYFGTAHYGFKASVQITASHNPAEYNGLKVSRENALPVGLDTGLGQIKEWVESGRECPPAPVKGQVRPMDIKADYLAFLLKYKGDWSGLKIAMDVSNGMASLLAHIQRGFRWRHHRQTGRLPAGGEVERIVQPAGIVLICRRFHPCFRHIDPRRQPRGRQLCAGERRHIVLRRTSSEHHRPAG